MSRFWSPIVHNLTPYVPGEQPKVDNLIKLNTNENPYGPSARVLDILKVEAADSLRLYPDPNGDALKSAIAADQNVSPAHVFVGNGSDEVLAHTFRALLQHDKPILFPDITYSFYPVYCGLFEVDYEAVALTEQFEIDPEDYKKPNGGIIFPNPNAPTGRAMTRTQIEDILKANPDSVVVVDEAYVDFGAETVVPLVHDYPQLLVTQTFSKSRSLAGLRVGYAIGDPGLVDALERVKNSFNSYPLDRFALAGAVASIEDHEHFESCRQAIMQSRERLSAALEELGFETLPSATNFVFSRHPQHDAAELSAALRERRIIVRHFRSERIDQYLRITIGTDAECDALIDALKEILA